MNTSLKLNWLVKRVSGNTQDFYYILIQTGQIFRIATKPVHNHQRYHRPSSFIRNLNELENSHRICPKKHNQTIMKHNKRSIITITSFIRYQLISKN